MLGLGLACKVTAILVAPVVLAAIALQLWQVPVRSGLRPSSLRAILEDAGQSERVMLGALLFLIAGFLAFRVAQPYAFETPAWATSALRLNQRWLDDQRSQSSLLGGDSPFPPTVQWIDRDSYLFPLQQMLTLGHGAGVRHRRLGGVCLRRLPPRFAGDDLRQLLPAVRCSSTSASWGGSSRSTCATSCRFTRCSRF